MGKAMVLRLLEQGVDVAAHNRTSQKVDELFVESQKLKVKSQKSGKFYKAYELDQLVKLLESPRIIWLMVPHGPPVDEMIEKLLDAGIEKGDIVIDGGNSFYKDSIRRYEYLKRKGVHFLDVGTSGGLEGARNGACLMIGGDRTVYKEVQPLFEAASCSGGYAYFGPAGAGHFVKMVHNGVEYGMLQAIGEGFEILAKGMPVTTPFARGTLAKTVRIDLHKVAQNWIHGSVVRGWLVELLEKALRDDPHLTNIEGVVGGGETGSWTLEVGKKLGVETPVITESLKARKKSLAKPTFSGKVVAALRREFGGHEIVKKFE